MSEEEPSTWNLWMAYGLAAAGFLLVAVGALLAAAVAAWMLVRLGVWLLG